MTRTDRSYASFAALLCAASLFGAEEGINKPYENPNPADFVKRFESAGRDIFDKRADIVAACKLAPGMHVADIGAGTGLFTRLFSPLVGEKGRVYAVDISKKFVDHIAATCAEQKLANVTGVVCTDRSVELPESSIDFAFICDTYHHFEYPAETMASVRRALKPGGKLVVIEFKRIEGESSDWTLRHIRGGQKEFTAEIEAAGFAFTDEVPLSKESYFIRFVAKADEPSAVKELVYAQTPQGELKLFVHFPPHWKATDTRPAIVFFFGGGWTIGSVAQFADQAAHLASRGMVAARADYRVKSRHGVKPDACVEDALAAMRFLRKNAATLGIDPARIAAAGGSAGGHIAACTAVLPPENGETVSAKPNALVLFNPVLCFTGVPLLMGLIGNDEKLAARLSPTLHVTKDLPPTILFYGTEDRLLVQGREFEQKAKAAGARVDFFTAEGVGHAFFNLPPWKEKTLARAVEFLASLGYVEAAPKAK
jgi:acetyl esterase